MKTFSTWKCFSIISTFLIQIVLSEPKWFTAIDGTRFLIELDEKFNWYQAQKSCNERDAQLVIIDTDEKNNLIKDILLDNLLKNYNIWIGGKNAYGDRGRRDDLDKLGLFYWTAKDKEFSYTYWSQDQPDNTLNRTEEYCVHILKNSFPPFGWKDNSCYSSEFGYICEEKFIELLEESKQEQGALMDIDNKVGGKTNEVDVDQTLADEENIKQQLLTETSTTIEREILMTRDGSTTEIDIVSENNLTWSHFPSYTSSSI